MVTFKTCKNKIKLFSVSVGHVSQFLISFPHKSDVGFYPKTQKIKITNWINSSFIHLVCCVVSDKISKHPEVKGVRFLGGSDPGSR